MTTRGVNTLPHLLPDPARFRPDGPVVRVKTCPTFGLGSAVGPVRRIERMGFQSSAGGLP